MGCSYFYEAKVVNIMQCSYGITIEIVFEDERFLEIEANGENVTLHIQKEEAENE